MSENAITLALGCSDLAVYDTFVSLEDGNGLILTAPPSGDVDEGGAYPGSFKFTGVVPDNLVAGHNSFNKIEIVVEDDLGNSHSLDITSNTGSVIFNHGNGGLVMDNSNPNRTYTITTKLYSDYCTTGNRKSYKVSYTA